MSDTSRKKRILLIHMGGTIGMSLRGSVLAPPESDEEYRHAIERVTRRFEDVHPDIELEYDCLTTIDSNEISPEHLEELVAYIKAREHEFDGFAITHGTDSYEKTLPGLSLGFLNLQDITSRHKLLTPIGVTGAQSSIHSIPQDAEKNLFNTLETVYQMCSGDVYYPRVVGVFGSKILDAPYVMKVNETEDDAMDVVNPEGVLGTCTSAFGIEFNHTFYANVAPLTPAQRELTLGFRQASGLQPKLPPARFMVSPKTAETFGDKTIYVPVGVGGYVHAASASTTGHPRNLSLQIEDPQCLAVIFNMTGCGNAPSMYLPTISSAVSDYGLPVYGTLAISGGQASTAHYESGNDLHNAGVATGFDASPAYKDMTIHALLSQSDDSVTSTGFMSRLRVGFHEMWYPGGIRNTELPVVPEAYNPGGSNPEKNFTQRHAAAISLVEAYREYKGSRLRWLDVKDPVLRMRVAAHLPKARIELIKPEHQNLDFAELTGWSPQPTITAAVPGTPVP